MRIFIILVSAAALAIALTAAAGGPGVRIGLWDYDAGTSLLRSLAAPAALATGAVTLGFSLALWRRRRLAPLAGLGVVVAGIAALNAVSIAADYDKYPRIHDITTDFDAPPEIIAGAGYPRSNPPDYAGDEFASRPQMTVALAQKSAYPDILPLIVETGIDQSARTVRVVLTQMGMEILAEGPEASARGNSWRIEAVRTSFWYGVKSDFVVRLTPLDDSRTRIDVRAKSRIGDSDHGANASRIRGFLRRVSAGG